MCVPACVCVCACVVTYRTADVTVVVCIFTVPLGPAALTSVLCVREATKSDRCVSHTHTHTHTHTPHTHTHTHTDTIGKDHHFKESNTYRCTCTHMFVMLPTVAMTNHPIHRIPSSECHWSSYTHS